MADKKPSISSVFGEDDKFHERQKAAQDALKNSEKAAAKQANRDDASNKPDETPAPIGSSNKDKSKSKKHWIIGSSAGLATMLILVVAISATVLLSPSLLLLNVKQKLSNDLNDALGFYYTTSEKVMAYQLSGGDGCSSEGDDSIHCKFSTMSEDLRDRYLGYGFQVSESEPIDLGDDELNTGRIPVSRVQFPGGDSANSGNLYQVANRSEVNRGNIDRVFNPSKGLFHSRGYIERLYEKFHIQQSQIPSGLTNEEVVDSFNLNLTRQADYMDRDGRGVYGLHYLAETEDDYWYEDVYEHILDKARSHLSLGCSMHTYADLGENALRQAKATTLARFAMQYMALGDSIKAGRTMQLEQIIGTMANNLTYVDSDNNTSAFTGSDMSSYRSPTFHEDPDIDGARMMHGTDFMADFTNMLTYVQGIGRDRSTYLRSIVDVPATNASVNPIDSSKIRDLCVHGTTGDQADYEMANPDRCWLEETLPTAAAFGPGATANVMATYVPLKMFSHPGEPACLGINRHVNLIKDGARRNTEPVRSSTGSYADRVRAAAEDEAEIYHLSEDISSGIHSTQTMDAVFAGTGVLLGDMAQWIGMQPATTNSLKNYLKDTVDIRTMLAQREIDAAKDTPLDITNPHSFVGSVVSQVYQDAEYDSVISLASKALSIVPNALSGVLGRTASATAGLTVGYLNDRLISDASDCGIENTNSQIHPDFSCSIRYSVNSNTMNLGVREVLDFMTAENGADDSSRENSDAVQGRDVERMGDHGDRMKSEDSEASSLPFIDPLTGKPNPNTEYGKFIEYCSERKTAWGSVGMAVAYQDEEYIPDEKDQTESRTYGPPFYVDAPPEESEGSEEVPESYYGYGWGGPQDYEWLTGEKCQEDSEMVNNFRAYTAMCAVHAATSGARHCWHHDSISLHRDDFAATNGIMFVSE